MSPINPPSIVHRLPGGQWTVDDWGHDRWTVDNFPFRRWRVDGGRWIDWGRSIIILYCSNLTPTQSNRRAELSANFNLLVKVKIPIWVQVQIP